MHPKALRGLKLFFATLTVGTCLQGIAPQGCAGVLQQNLEVLLRFDAVNSTPEMFQSWIWQVLRG